MVAQLRGGKNAEYWVLKTTANPAVIFPAPAFTLAIAAGSRIARLLERAHRRAGVDVDPVRFAASALEPMLRCALEDPGTLANIAWRAGHPSLFRQIVAPVA